MKLVKKHTYLQDNAHQLRQSVLPLVQVLLTVGRHWLQFTNISLSIFWSRKFNFSFAGNAKNTLSCKQTDIEVFIFNVLLIVHRDISVQW